ncbi:alpha/beta hydrolase family protein [Sphingorhabdus arenilitoris]|uniref:Alpha/beta hydrolase family protein n=1 Tax=Sphingorhabdus arenilitoris TaxID=1490041 RepID=A0ABV8RBX5_9SPHN
MYRYKYMLKAELCAAIIFAPAAAMAQDAATAALPMETAGGDVAAAAAKQNTSAAAPVKLPMEAFAKLPFVEQPSISPDGTHLAGLFAINGQQRIVITPLVKDAGKQIILGVPDETSVYSVRWVNDNNILLGVYSLIRVESDRWYVSRLLSVNRVSGEVQRLLPRMGGQNAADVLWVPSDGSNEILVSAQDSIYTNVEGFWPSVYKVNVETGTFRRHVPGKFDVLDWGADADGNVRLGIAYDDATRRSTLLYAKEDSRGFRAIERANLREDERLNIPFLFIPGTDKGLVMKDNDDEKTIIVETDMATGQDVRTVFEADSGDVESVMLSYDGKALLGVETSEAGEKIWFDGKLKAAQEQLEAAAKNADVDIISFNRDQSKLVVRISSPDNPGLIYIYDTNSQDLAQFASVNEQIGNRRLARPKLVQYKARDGLEIEGVLTLPKGRTGKNLPFIVMPHGGPWAHDTLTYDYWAQFLANSGYAVLQPNFRGSTGYGKKFVDAGKGQMGLAMQDDVTDGVKWAVEQGIADPKRVCIVGASYGGYAAMWGVVKDPDLYRCSISIAGVSAVRREVNDFGNSVRERLYRDQWREMAADFNAISPINGVDRIKAPLLLIHGKKDVTVDHIQSEKMHKAMEKAGKNVEFVSIPLADHYFTREEDRKTLLSSMASFLAKHNPAD